MVNQRYNNNGQDWVHLYKLAYNLLAFNTILVTLSQALRLRGDIKLENHASTSSTYKAIRCLQGIKSLIFHQEIIVDDQVRRTTKYGSSIKSLYVKLNKALDYT
jgi:TnpA family transposase